MNTSMRLLVKQWALVPLRLVVGLGFAFHGYAKLARGPERFAAILTSIGIPASTGWRG
jgi:putative oxidoreductase